MTVLLWAGPAFAQPRSKAVSPPAQTVRLLPGGEAPATLEAPVLTGLDYSAIAPSGFMLRIVEDEPYIYSQGDSARGSQRVDQGFSAIRLIGLLDDGGRFEARILLRDARGAYAAQLLESFDQTVHSAYIHSAAAQERREVDLYQISELRTPLGLLGGERQRKAALPEREFLAYDAEVVNPLTVESFANLTTPYRQVNGELQAAWPVRGRSPGAMLLNIEFTAERYPHSLTLAENLARCVLNRVRAVNGQAERLSYLAYYPEFELPGLNALWSGRNIDSRTADLAERPGEGVGFDAQPPQGDLCPQYLGEGPVWPAAPYGDWQYLRTLRQTGQPLPRCSHCLLDAATPDERRRREEQVVELPREEPPAPAAPGTDAPPAPPEAADVPGGLTVETAAPASVCRCGSEPSGRTIRAPRGHAMAASECGCRTLADEHCQR